MEKNYFQRQAARRHVKHLIGPNADCSYSMNLLFRYTLWVISALTNSSPLSTLTPSLQRYISTVYPKIGKLRKFCVIQCGDWGVEVGGVTLEEKGGGALGGADPQDAGAE